MLDQGRLAEVELSRDVTGGNKSASFLVLLSSAEQAEYHDTGRVPQAKIDLLKSSFLRRKSTDSEKQPSEVLKVLRSV